MTPATPAPSVSERAVLWWQQWCGPQANDPAMRARLRRCRSTVEAIREPAALALSRRIGGMREGATDAWLDRTLDLARVLAHVREDDDSRPMRVVGWKSFPGIKGVTDATAAERPQLSEVRFRRLIETPAGEPLVTAFVRLIRVLGGRINVRQVASDFLYWNDRTKKQWAFDYYAAAMAAPADEPSTQEIDA